MEHPSNGELSEQIDQLSERFEALTKRLDPIIEAYDSVLFGKKFLTGLAAVVAAIAIIGGGIIWVINYVRHGG